MEGSAAAHSLGLDTTPLCGLSWLGASSVPTAFGFWHKPWENDSQACFLASPTSGPLALAPSEIPELEVAIPGAAGASLELDRPRLGPQGATQTPVRAGRPFPPCLSVPSHHLPVDLVTFPGVTQDPSSPQR